MFIKMFCLLFLMILSIYDIRTRKIPNIALAFLFIVLFSIDCITSPAKIPRKLLCSFFFLIVFLLTSLITKGIGMGDIKLAAIIGYCSGFFKTSLILITASVLAVSFFTINILRNKKIEKLPFVPFITLGCIISEIIYRRFY